MKRIYLDVSVLCRPFDDQRAMRIRLETDAFYLILRSVQEGAYEMVVSPAHFAEVNANQDFRQRLQVLALLEQTGMVVDYDWGQVRARAEELVSFKFGVADAAHAAFAEASADFLISCDDRLLKKGRKHLAAVQVMNPIEFCLWEDLR